MKLQHNQKTLKILNYLTIFKKVLNKNPKDNTYKKDDTIKHFSNAEILIQLLRYNCHFENNFREEVNRRNDENKDN